MSIQLGRGLLLFPGVTLLLVAACATQRDRPVELGTELRFSRIPVPEDPSRPDGRTIELNVVVLPAIESREGAAPLFLLEGGPGIAATDAAEFFVADGAAYRRFRDVVLVDMRGTGDSHPLHCPGLEGVAIPVERQLGEIYPPDEVVACRDRLRADADLTQYTTANLVLDLEAVRSALGYERIDIQAISHGARVGQEYLRAYPKRVRSFVAIGAVSASHRTPLLHAEGFQRAFDLLLADCESDEPCSAAYPDLRGQWTSLLEELERSPARVRTAPTDEAPPLDLEIRRDVFVETIRSAMYLASSARGLPRVIDAAARGDFSPFLELALPGDADAASALAEGLYLSVTCSEDVRRITDADVLAHTAGTYLGDDRVEQQRRACALWPRAQHAVESGRAVTSAVPSLLITGDRDPVTPPTEARSVAETLENSRLLIVPHAGHLPFDGDGTICIDGIILSFFERGSAEGLDTSCVDELVPALFVLP